MGSSANTHLACDPSTGLTRSIRAQPHPYLQDGHTTLVFVRRGSVEIVGAGNKNEQLNLNDVAIMSLNGTKVSHVCMSCYAAYPTDMNNS